MHDWDWKYCYRGFNIDEVRCIMQKALESEDRWYHRMIECQKRRHHHHHRCDRRWDDTRYW